MNAQTVQLAATAFARWLPANSTVVIGRDARHGSKEFAEVTARVLTDAGHRVRMFAEPVPTPVVAFEIGRTDAAGGVVVTASHNPASDNGYKVYVADGGQLLPDDAAAIESIMSGLTWPAEIESDSNSLDRGSVEWLGEAEIDGYVSTIMEGTAEISGGGGPGQVIVYTAMHGVGGELTVRVLEAAGHTVHAVREQQSPDPDFPSAPFPNPEEPGTLDLAMALAVAVEADLILANDPDADRLAVAVPRRAKGAAEVVSYERLTGDEIGALLGGYLMKRSVRPSVVATTIVSSTLLDKIASAEGIECRRTLTGFKWLSRAGSSAAPLCFAYEEALGYAVLPDIRDKDGISAAICFAALAAEATAEGHSIDDLLGALYAQHGVHRTSQISKRFEGGDAMGEMSAFMARLRRDPPASLAGDSVTEIEDFSMGTATLVASDVLILHLADCRVAIRPSGTEPKLKSYLEVVAASREVASQRLTALDAATRELLGVDR